MALCSHITEREQSARPKLPLEGEIVFFCVGNAVGMQEIREARNGLD